MIVSRTHVVERHLGCELDLVAVVLDDCSNLAGRAGSVSILVEDLDLVLNADARCLSQALDSVGDLAAEAMLHEALGLDDVKHDSC